MIDSVVTSVSSQDRPGQRHGLGLAALGIALGFSLVLLFIILISHGIQLGHLLKISCKQRSTLTLGFTMKLGLAIYTQPQTWYGAVPDVWTECWY